MYKGVYDPTCACTDEKWKVHANNAFGANQHEDIKDDKYWIPSETSGSKSLTTCPPGLNSGVLGSVEGKPMTWNLWNIVRHYVYVQNYISKGKKFNGT